MTDLLLRGDPADLEDLRRAINSELGREAHLQPVTSAQPGELREPILIGLIVALGGPAVTTAIVQIVKRFWDNKERMRELDNERRQHDQDHEFRMALVGADDEERPITLDELRRYEDQGPDPE